MNVAFAELHPRFAAMRDYLDGLKHGHRMACAAELDPRGFQDWLAFVNLIDVGLHRDAVRFRFRLVGTAQSRAAQLEYEGRFVDDVVDPASCRRVIEDLTRVVATCMPHYGRYGMPFPGRGFIDSERVFFPLSNDGRMVNSILALHRYPELETQEDAGFTAQAWHLDAWQRAMGAEGR
jgi:hypothetical protein